MSGKVVSEADGYQHHLIAPEQGCHRLIEGALSYFKGPVEASVDVVHLALKDLVRKSIGETRGKQLWLLLDENPALMESRVQCVKMLELYKSAMDEIEAVSWGR